mmetsp:Transcript_139910/g.389979  ORF Transcript_139910/g.389979 Transcript_139910/m.389979 type:complete len:284 (+) Transcript_139910:82-933(+)
MPSFSVAWGLLASLMVTASAVRSPSQPVAAANLSVVASALAATRRSGKERSNRTADQPPCQCEAFSTRWKWPQKRSPACLFIDLGAADGETYKAFLNRSSKWSFDYNVGSFTHGDCFAYLIEANPKFTKDLEGMRTGRVYPMISTAAYMCDKEHEHFYLDVSGPQGWGSSLDQKHESVSAKKQSVDVQLYNLMRLLQENALPEDTVVVKMDIEGAEYDILPCLADSPAASLIDTLYLEDHCPGDWWCPTKGQAGNSKETFNKAIQKLRQRGVSIPDGYWSPML